MHPPHEADSSIRQLERPLDNLDDNIPELSAEEFSEVPEETVNLSAQQEESGLQRATRGVQDFVTKTIEAKPRTPEEIQNLANNVLQTMERAEINLQLMGKEIARLEKNLYKKLQKGNPLEKNKTEELKTHVTNLRADFNKSKEKIFNIKEAVLLQPGEQPSLEKIKKNISWMDPQTYANKMTIVADASAFLRGKWLLNPIEQQPWLEKVKSWFGK